MNPEAPAKEIRSAIRWRQAIVTQTGGASRVSFGLLPAIGEAPRSRRPLVRVLGAGGAEEGASAATVREPQHYGKHARLLVGASAQGIRVCRAAVADAPGVALSQA